jgi:hypothetical protein
MTSRYDRAREDDGATPAAMSPEPDARGDHGSGGSATSDESEPLWCEECNRLVEPALVGDDGRCPDCGTELVDERARPGRRRVPWTFRLMIVASVIYLGYRAFQGISWIVHHV